MFTAVSQFVHKRFVWLLIGAYLVAAVCPNPGLWLRHVSFGEVGFAEEKTTLSLPMAMLAFILFHAGLGVPMTALRQLVRRPSLLALGLSANLVVPLAFLWGVSQTMRFWHNPDELQTILVGLALVVAMPIAGSSTAWTQNANGDMALSLALVLFSTFLSPLTTPLTFELVEQMATGEYAQVLDSLESTGTSFMFWVIVPSLLGILGRHSVGADRIASVKPYLRLANGVNLLLLVYSNAALSLPQAVANPDWDFLAALLAIVVGLCVAAFASGWLLAHLLNVDHAQQTSLMFGLGMNNNGTGLVLASMVLVAWPQVMLPIILYNLVQHLVAGCVDYLLRHRSQVGLPRGAEA